MTECERLVKEGFVPEEFLQPETRECYVPTEMKKLWAIQIDLIRQVDIICERHNMKFYAIAGTALGAVRHHGYIPWDDDVDLAMKREDYNRFIEYAQTELPEPYFVQTPVTDPYFFSPHVWLRNSNSTGISRGDGVTKCNNGVPIHIFPLDSFIDDEAHRKYLKRLKNQFIVALNSAHYNGINNYWLIRRVLKLICPLVIGGSRATFFKRYEKRSTEMTAAETSPDFLGHQNAVLRNRIRGLMSRPEVYDDVTWLPFEFYKIPVPVGWDEMLKDAYGDYMTLPPEEKRVCKHSWETDTDTPYKEYCAKKYGVRY